MHIHILLSIKFPLAGQLDAKLRHEALMANERLAGTHEQVVVVVIQASTDRLARVASSLAGCSWGH